MPVLKPSRGRSARDRTKPDPPSTPFRAFINENHAIFKADNPDYDYVEMKRLFEDMWEVMDDEQIKYYENLAQDDKWRYIEEWEAWLRQRFGVENPIEPSKFPELPKRPTSGFRIFGELKKTHFTKLLPESQLHEIAGLVHKEWN